jgi:hypothetical protein
VAVVVNDPVAAASGFEVQLRSELQAAGFEVVMLQDPASSAPELEALAEKHQSIAAILFDRPAGSVAASVWVTDRMTGKTLLRAVRPEKVSAEAPSIIALRAVELLRASLLELNEAHPPRGTVPAPPSVRAWIKPSAEAPSPPPASRPQPWGLSVGPTVLGSPGGMPAGLAPAVSFLWRPAATMTGELRWEGPFLGTVESELGTATVSQKLLTFRARWEPWAGRWMVSPWGALGLGGHHLGSRGNADSPYVGRTDGAYTLVALAGLGARIHIARGFSVVPELDVIAAANRPVLHLSDRTAVYAGRPWVSGTICLELAW